MQLVTIAFQTRGGVTQLVETAAGRNLMEIAVKANVEGIDADCGGACACATCHVYVSETWLGKLDPKGDMEQSMLEYADNVSPLSRLACQILVTDGLEVEVAEPA